MTFESIFLTLCPKTGNFVENYERNRTDAFLFQQHPVDSPRELL